VGQVKFWTTARELEVCGSVARLMALLDSHGAGSRDKVLVLLADTQKHLKDLHAMRTVLSEYRIILVLPDGKEKTLTMGRALYPRFLTSFDEAPGELGAVLNRMMQSAAEGPGPKPSSPQDHRNTASKPRKRTKPSPPPRGAAGL
jgi:hypothetical protein